MSILIENKTKTNGEVSIDLIDENSYLMKLINFFKKNIKLPTNNIIYSITICPILIGALYQLVYLLGFNGLVLFSWQQVFSDAWTVGAPLIIIILLFFSISPAYKFITKNYKKTFDEIHNEIDANLNSYEYKKIFFGYENNIIDIHDFSKIKPKINGYKNIDGITNNKRVVKIKKISFYKKYLIYSKYLRLFPREGFSLVIISALILLSLFNINIITEKVIPGLANYCYLSDNKYTCEEGIYVYGNDKWVILSRENIVNIMNDYKIIPMSEIKKISPYNK